MNELPSGGRSGLRDTSPHGVETVLSMIRQLGRLSPRVHFERSFKLTHGRCLSDRFLFGVERPQAGAAADAAVAALCQSIGMPTDCWQGFQAALHDANHIYFGAERDQASLTFKAYLEFRDKIASQQTAAQDRLQSHELYVGYKWDASNPSRRAVSHYDWFPGLSPQEMLQRVQSMVVGGSNPGLQALTAEIVMRASEAITPQAMQFLEVLEVGNPRRSFDINVYKMELRLVDWLPALHAAQVHFALPTAAFDALLARIGSERVGHFAAGVDRQGQDFLTVYYGGTILDGDRLERARLAGVTS